LEQLLLLGLIAGGWFVYRLVATDAARRRDRELFGMTSDEAARSILGHNQGILDDLVEQHRAEQPDQRGSEP
jgi:hypothetical protein